MRPGTFFLGFNTSGKTVRKRVTVAEGTTLRRTGPAIGANWGTALANSQEERISKSLFQRIEVNYPQRAIDIWGWEFNWLTVFLILSLAFALLLKRPLKVAL